VAAPPQGVGVAAPAVEPHQIYDYAFDSIEVTVPSGTAAGTIVDGVKLTPPSGRVWYLQYLKVVTPPEVEAKFLVDTVDTVDRELPPEWIPESETWEEDMTKWTDRGMRVLGVNLRARAAVETAVARVVKLEFKAEVAPRLY